MKKSLLICALLGLVFLQAGAQGSKVYDNLSLPSKLLKMDRKYSIYLPPGYETSQRSYPVLYLLHGAGDDQTGWVQFGEVQWIADKAIEDGTATPMIIVMPDANTGHRGYDNDAKGEWRYEDFFITELIPFVEKTYHAKADKHYRAVAGLSMGGGGSFTYALHHPELFSSACPLSAYAGPPTFEETKQRILRDTKDVSDTLVSKFFKRQNVLQLIAAAPVEQLKSVRWYIDCGDDDFLYEGNSLIHIALRKKEVPHEFRIRDGGHTWPYWRSALPEVLKFVSMAYHQY